jgi:hypothetical protein
MPGWLQDESGGVQAYWQNYYNSGSDPSSLINDFRAKNKGAAEDDESVMRAIAGGGGGVKPEQPQSGGGDTFDKNGNAGIGGQLQDIISKLLGSQGQLSDEQRAMRIERARRPVDAMRRSQTDSYRGALANRGLLSVPGIAQGQEIGAAGRLEERLAPLYADAAQGIAIDENQRDDQRFLAALNGGLGLFGTQSDNLLGQLSAGLMDKRLGLDEKLGLGQLALGNLNANMSWNKFLAEFGLQREQVMHQIQQGGIDKLMPLLEMFRDYVNASQGGYR